MGIRGSCHPEQKAHGRGGCSFRPLRDQPHGCGDMHGRYVESHVTGANAASTMVSMDTAAAMFWIQLRADRLPKFMTLE